jgi:hypothetical protein
MPITHIFYIPIVFFLGLFFGSVIAQYRLGVYAADLSLARHIRRSAIALGIFVAVFIATHALGFAGGSASLEVALGGSPILDKLPSFSQEEVHARLVGFGEKGRDAYKRFTFTADFVFPLSLLLFLLSLSTLVYARIKARTQIGILLFIFPILWFLSDMLENAIVYRLLAEFPDEDVRLSGAIGYVTMIKFGLLAASIALVAVVNGLCNNNKEAR